MPRKNFLLVPYILAGYPSKRLFIPILKILSQGGADYIEVGVPHSDPLADGPTIQKASKMALDNGVNLKWIVETLRATSLQKKIKPLILFSYFNPVLKYGLEKLLHDLPKQLFYGLIIPDLPLEEAGRYLPLFKKYKLNFIPLVAPTTKMDKIKKIVNACRGMSSGFIYLVSVTGVTGVRSNVSLSLREKLSELKDCTKKPVVVGFGISKPVHVDRVVSLGGDGVVIGSAIIEKLHANSKAVLPGLKSFICRFKQTS